MNVNKHLVRATREGRIGGTTASGYVIPSNSVLPFVALPSRRALGRILRVTNPLTGINCLCMVMDVGPHNTADDAYVFGGARPLAESQAGSNGAGIDFGERVWTLLQMKDNTSVEWHFL
jgi:hypothetical protein